MDHGKNNEQRKIPYIPGKKNIKAEVRKLMTKYGVENLTVTEPVVAEEIDISSIESHDPSTPSQSYGFWLLGFCTNFGYTVLVTAAHDITDNEMTITSEAEHVHVEEERYYARDCNDLSTGTFLLFSAVPELIAQIMAALFPFCAHVKMVIICVLLFCGYIISASSSSSLVLYFGIGCISFSTGLAEATVLSYLSLTDNEKLLLTYSSGNGFAGLLGALWYISLVALHYTSSTILYLLTILPILMAVTFWGILNKALWCCCAQNVSSIQHSSDVDLNQIRKMSEIFNYLSRARRSFQMNVIYLPQLCPYIMTTVSVYFCTYYIEQCLYELMYFTEFTLTHDQQYRWYQVTSNFAVLLVNSSLQWMTVKTMWYLPLLQFINAVFLTFVAIYKIIPHFTFALCFIFLGGLISGYSFTTLYSHLYTEVNQHRRRFSIIAVVLSETIGATCAALISEPVHGYICDLPLNLSIWDTSSEIG